MRLTFLCLAVLLALPPLPRNAAGDEPATPPAAAEDVTLDDVIASLRKWRESFGSIEIVWHQWNHAEVEEAYPELAGRELDGLWYFRETFIWTDAHKKLHSLDRFEDGALVSRNVWGFDGNMLFQADSREGAPDKWGHVIRSGSSPTGRAISNIGVSAMDGLWMTTRGQWLDEWLATIQRYGWTEWQGPVDVEGQTYYRLRAFVGVFEWTIDFDPAHGLLPRRKESITNFDGVSVWTWTATEFREADGILYPAHGFWQLYEDQVPGSEWDVKKAAFNKTYPKDFFKPPPATTGTVLTDLTRGTSSVPHPSRNGPAESAAAQSVPEAAAAVTDPARVTPPRSLWPRILMWSGILLLTVVASRLLFGRHHADPQS